MQDASFVSWATRYQRLDVDFLVFTLLRNIITNWFINFNVDYNI
jgi:hypothetical protein